jgi:ribose transport system substrate-binding protein
MKTSRVFLVVVVAAVLLLSACGGKATPTPAPPAATPAPAATAAATPVPPTAAPVAATSAPAAAAYKPEIRPAQQAWKIGYGNGYAGIPFTASVTKSINEVAAKMGVQVVECDHAADQEKTFACADNFIAQKVDGVVFANWVGGMAEALAKKYKDAGMPMVTYDGAHPGAIDFGADNYTAGLLAGKYLGEYARKQGWDPNAVSLVSATIPGQVVIEQRVKGFVDGVQSVFAVPAANIYEIKGEKQGQALTEMTDWLTAHPQAKYVLGFGHSDQPGVEIASALETAGLLATSAVAGEGASDEALVDLRDRTDATSAFKASVSFFPEHYGDYLVPVIVDLIEGKPVSEHVYVKNAVIDRSNLNEYYPKP